MNEQKNEVAVKTSNTMTIEQVLDSPAVKSLGTNLQLSPRQLAKANSAVLRLLNDPKLNDCNTMSKIRFCYQVATLGYANDNAVAPVPYGKSIQAQVQYQGLIEDVLATGKVEEVACVPIYKGIDYKAFVNSYGYKEMVVPEKIELTDVFEEKEVIGYYAYAKCENGKVITCLKSNDQIKEHAKKYSVSFRSGKGVWVDSWDKMARKTVLKEVARLVLLDYPFDRLSHTLQLDQAVFNENGVDYDDNPKDDDKVVPTIVNVKEAVK